MLNCLGANRFIVDDCVLIGCDKKKPNKVELHSRVACQLSQILLDLWNEVGMLDGSC